MTTLEIIGNKQCHSPYSGTEPITLKLSGAQPKKFYEIQFPTNYVASDAYGMPLRTGSAGYIEADENGDGSFIFNDNPSETEVTTAHSNGWLLPAGTYQFVAREFYNSETPVSVDFEIIGDAATAVAAITKGRGKNKNNK